MDDPLVKDCARDKNDLSVSLEYKSSSPDSLAGSRDGELLGALRSSAERKLVRKLDMRLLPTIVLIYIMNYIDVRWFI